MFWRTVIFSAILCICMQQSQAGMPPELLAMMPPTLLDVMMNLRNICSQKFELTPDQIDNFVMSNDTPKPYKCYMACMMATIGWMDDKGKINTDKMLASTPPKIKELLLGMVNKCRDIPEGEQCETAYKFNVCMYNAEPKMYFLV